MKIYNFGNDYVAQRKQDSAQALKKEESVAPLIECKETIEKTDDQDKISDWGGGEMESTSTEKMESGLPESESETPDTSKKKKETRSKKADQADDQI